VAEGLLLVGTDLADISTPLLTSDSDV